MRTAKCSLKFLTPEKRRKLRDVLDEYSLVVNCFIDRFWESPPTKGKLLKPIINAPDTWLSHRMRKVAAREALDLIGSVKLWRKDELAARSKPVHRGGRMHISSTIGTLKAPEKAKEFDCWLELRCIGRKIGIDIPIRKHRQFNKLIGCGRRLNSYVVTPDYVRFSFEIDTGPKKEVKTAIGVDTGINALASLSTGAQFGTDVRGGIDRIYRCKYGSKGQQRARRALRHKIDVVAKQVAGSADLIVVENLKGICHGTKLKRRLSRNMRRYVGAWNVRYWLNRLQMDTETSRATFRSVPARGTSIECPRCGQADVGNRVGEVFRCLSCGHTNNADVNAGGNILRRFLTGPYGSGYKAAIERYERENCTVRELAEPSTKQGDF